MSDARWIALLTAGAFLVRFTAWMGSAIFGTDSGHYLLMADWFRAGRVDDALAVAYHPLYPLLIAAVRSVTVTTEQAGNLVSVILGSAAAVPLFKSAQAAFGRPAAFLTVLIYAFQPKIVEVQSDVMTESTFMFFFFSSVWLTWRCLESPNLARSVVLGACSAAAFLTRAEGILVLVFAGAWPTLELVRLRRPAGLRLAGILLTLATAILVVSPFLLWVKQYRGRWSLSIRPSVTDIESGIGLPKDAANGGVVEVRKPPNLYPRFLSSMNALTSYDLLVPFYLVGLFSLRAGVGRKGLFYFSYPLSYVAGLLYSLRSHDVMSDRYVMVPMMMLGAVAALGMITVWKAMHRRWPEAPWLPAACGAMMLVVMVAPGARALRPRRQDCLSYPVAARWILSQGRTPRGMSGPVEQMAYLTGCRSYYSEGTDAAIREQLHRLPIEYFVYTDADVEKRRDYIRMLQDCDRLDPPVEIEGPAGSRKVFIQKVK